MYTILTTDLENRRSSRHKFLQQAKLSLDKNDDNFDIFMELALKEHTIIERLESYYPGVLL